MRLKAHLLNDFDATKFFSDRQISSFDRQSQIASVAVELALMDSCLKISDILDDDKGLLFGTFLSTATNMSDFDESVLRDGPRRCGIGIFPNTVMSAATSRISIIKSIKGSNTTISSGRNSGFDAIGYAYAEIVANEKDAIICGGSDALSTKILKGLSGSVGVYDENSNVVRDEQVEKIIPAEGATVLVLQSDRSSRQKVYAYVSGFAAGFSTCRKDNAFERSRDLHKAIVALCKRLDLRSGDIDCVFMSEYFNPCGFRIEKDAIDSFFLGSPSVPVVAPKRIFGESFANSGALNIGIAAHLIGLGSDANSIIGAILNPDLSLAQNRQFCNILLTNVDMTGNYSVAILSKEAL